MKRLLLLTFLLPAILTKGQSDQPKFYIGISAGISKFLNSETKLPAGSNINFVNVSYSIIKRFGVAGKWVGARHQENFALTLVDQGTSYTAPAERVVNYNALMIGPMYSIKIANNLSLEPKVFIGKFSLTEKITNPSLDSKEKSWNIAYSIGAALKYNIIKHLYTTVQADFIQAKLEHSLNYQRVDILNLNLGIGLSI